MNKLFFRFWMTCEIDYIPQNIYDSINEQLVEYFQDIHIGGMNIAEKLGKLTVCKNLSETTLIFSFTDSEDVILTINTTNIPFKTEYQKVMFPEYIKNYIMYCFILKYDEYILDKYNTNYINISEDYAR